MVHLHTGKKIINLEYSGSATQNLQSHVQDGLLRPIFLKQPRFVIANDALLPRSGNLTEFVLRWQRNKVGLPARHPMYLTKVFRRPMEVARLGSGIDGKVVPPSDLSVLFIEQTRSFLGLIFFILIQGQTL